MKDMDSDISTQRNSAPTSEGARRSRGEGCNYGKSSKQGGW